MYLAPDEQGGIMWPRLLREVWTAMQVSLQMPRRIGRVSHCEMLLLLGGKTVYSVARCYKDSCFAWLSEYRTTICYNTHRGMAESRNVFGTTHSLLR